MRNKTNFCSICGVECTLFCKNVPLHQFNCIHFFVVFFHKIKLDKHRRDYLKKYEIPFKVKILYLIGIELI
ncbi:hypothetical protein BpHYR1_051893 [Brachionus plicatilis]|uniref:Uncharacterized protein n=1 Tax=Brachionus plicatilis TaxID=10195 RepID=A0A3M7RMD3_BRAPC|nr:hypothetical protein BpHYR1_051893 [Brachionus plicatilis]